MSRLLGIEGEDCNFNAWWEALQRGRECVCPQLFVVEEMFPGSLGVDGLHLVCVRRRCGGFRWGSGGIGMQGSGGRCSPFR